VSNIVHHLKEWGESASVHPYKSLFMSRFMLFAFISGLKGLLLRDSKVSRWPTMIASSIEQEYTARVIRWRGHMPKAALRDDPDRAFQYASSTPTIAVVGDIRRSQDLMTYAKDPKAFSVRMVQFITTTRELIEKHAGFFDKFTGDGFIVYFNEAICNTANLGYIDCFLNFIRDEFHFATPLFDEWSRSIRKRPTTEIGLAIGADIGKVNFEDVHDHLVAVSNSIVWASRMASIANSSEAIVNNLLFAVLDGRTDIKFQSREGKTKAGESFLAQSLLFNSTEAPG